MTCEHGNNEEFHTWATEYILQLAEQAAADCREREDEDVSEWAERLASEISEAED